MIGPALEHALMVQQRASCARRRPSARRWPRAGCPTPQEIAVAFADLVDFTKLGESVDPGSLGAVAARLEELTRDVAQPTRCGWSRPSATR